MKTTLKTLTLAALALLAALIAHPAQASAYNYTFTAAFGTAKTGLQSSVVVYVFDTSGVCHIGPATLPGLNGASSTSGPNNEPTIAESADYTGYQVTGTYRMVLPLDTSWGALHIHTVITGQAGVVADYTLPNRGPDVADGYLASIPPAITATNTQTSSSNQISNGAAALNSLGYNTSRATRLDNLDALISTRLATSGYTAPPALPGDFLSSAEQAKLAFLDIAISTRLAASGYTPPANPTDYARNNVSPGWYTQITLPGDFLNAGEQAKLALLDAAISSRLASSSYTAPPTLPTEYLSIAEIAKLSNLDATISSRSTYAGTDTAGTTTLLGRIPGTVQPQTGDAYAQGTANAAAIAALPNANAIANALLGTTFITIPASHTTTGVSEALTYKQWLAIIGAVPASDGASTLPVASSTATTSYYLAGQPAGSGTLVYISTNTYDGGLHQTGRTVKIVQPFPAIN